MARPRRFSVGAPVPGTDAVSSGRSVCERKCAPPYPFQFTGKELDRETGLYYYGARYLNPQTSIWLSADPAMGEYIPRAPVDDEAKKYNQNLPGMGGVFNYINLHAYHYAGNNPVKLTDPTGAIINRITSFDTQNSDRNKQLVMGPNLLPVPLPDGRELEGYIGYFGCLFAAMVNIGNTIRQQTPNISSALGNPARPLSDYVGNQNYYVPDSVLFQNAPGLLKAMTGKDFTAHRVRNGASAQNLIQFYNESTTSGAYIIGEVHSEKFGTHFINILGVESDGNLIYHDTYENNGEKYTLSSITGLWAIQEKYNDPINK
jgi:RHS repeat-associated protein